MAVRRGAAAQMPRGLQGAARRGAEPAECGTRRCPEIAGNSTQQTQRSRPAKAAKSGLLAR